MIVSTCGFGSTGSSAASDYLKECEETCVVDQLEFTIASCVDGLEDLEYHLIKKHSRQSDSIYAIQRFQKLIHRSAKAWNKWTGIPQKELFAALDAFIDAITQVEYVGISPRIYKGGSPFLNTYLGRSIILSRIVRPLEKKKILKKNIDIYPFAKVRMSIGPENFYTEAQKFVKRVLRGMGADLNKIVVLDQAFSGCDPAKSFPFYEDPYAIVVDRDPRDLYIFAKKVLLSRGRFMPSENVQDFIKYYRLLRQNQPYTKPNERCLVLRFEDMVYDYENSAAKIDAFIGIENKKRKTIFIPEISAPNTNLIRKFPEFSADVAVIERELEEYLFDFSKYPQMGNSDKMFFGKSPLNKK